MGKIKPIISVRKMDRHYHTPRGTVFALNEVNFEIEEGEFIAVIGASGSGKTTMLRVLGLMDDPTKGDYFINGLNVKNLPEEEKTFFRLTQLGYIFQDYALINEMTALENVSILSIMEGKSKKEAYAEARDSLAKVGLAEMESRIPNELSGGEKQRVSIARAITKKPHILFADEPCANLDTVTSTQILNVLKELNEKYNQTIVMVTHEPEHLKYASRIIELKDGFIIKDKKV